MNNTFVIRRTKRKVKLLKSKKWHFSLLSSKDDDNYHNDDEVMSKSMGRREDEDRHGDRL